MEPKKNEQNEPEYAFVKERIIVERPAKKAGFFKRFLITLFLGIIFGGVSAVVFVVALPYIQEYFHHPEQPVNSGGGNNGEDRVSIPLDDDMTDESSTKDTDSTAGTEHSSSTQATETEVITSTEETSSTGNQGLTEEMVGKLIDEALSEQQITITDYKILYEALGTVVNKVNRSIVTVTASSTVIDILEHSYDVIDTVSGVIYSITENDVCIMTNYAKVKDADSIKVSFLGGYECDAKIQMADDSSDIAVIRIEKSELDNSTLTRIQAVALGNSYAVKTGDPVIAVGDPMGYMYTMSYGIVTATTYNFLKSLDAHYRVINTNVVKSSAGNGFLINLDGELVGILFDEDGEINSLMTADICAAVTISDLKRRLERISNNEQIPYFGIMGEDIVNGGISPQGIYVLQTDIDSPAYNAGILNGDIIVGMADMDNMSMKSLRNFLETSAIGDIVDITVMRKGKDEYKEMTFEVVLGEN